MKKRFFILKNSIFVLIVLFCTGILGCDILWHDDLHERLEAETSATIHFYSDKEEVLAVGKTPSTAEKSYKIGETISAADLPLHTDSRSAQWIRDLKVGGWRFYRWTSHKEPSDTPVFTVDEKNIITSLKIPADDIDVYAVYMAAYTVVTKVQNTDGATYTETQTTDRGEVGTETCVTAEEKEGFLPPTVENKTIAGDGSTVVEIVYNRKTITITLDAGEGAFDGGAKTKTLSGLYGAEVPKDGKNPVWSDEKPFARWNPPLPETYPKEDMTSTAVYIGQEYEITYYDAYGKTFSGKKDALPKEYKYGEKLPVPKPETAVSAAENTVEFAGWFKKDDNAQTDAELDEDGSGWYISDTTAGDLSLYAKWKMQNVYVNPVSGDDSTGNGLSPASPLKTIAEAKKYLPDSLENPCVKVLNPISAAEDVPYLSGLTTPAYNNAVLQPAQGYTGTLINAGSASGAAALSNLTIDGGQPYTASGTPIVISGNGDVTFGQNVVIQNFTISGSASGLLKVSGKLTLDGGCCIKQNTLSSGYAIDLTAGGTLHLKDCTITQNTLSSGYAISCASALYMQGATKIDEATPIYLSTGCAVSVAGALSQNPAAKLYAAEYKAQPTVLTGDAMLVSANYGKFAVSHEGYYINANGKLIANSSGGGIGSEKHECEFSLETSDDMMTGGPAKTLTVKATVTAHGAADNVKNPLTDPAWKDVSIKVLCGNSEVSGVTIAGGTITIPAGAKAETYRITISGTYTCGECGSPEHFDGELGFVIEPPDVYVSQSGNDTGGGDGTQAKPFATLQKAFDAIKNHNDGTLSYTIHVSGTVKGNSELAAAVPAQKILITGTAGADTDILNEGSASSNNAVITVKSAVPVEITDVKLTGGNCGISVENGANVTLGEGAVISGNKRGASVDGTFTMEGGTIAENTAESGAGVSVGSNGSFTMSGGTISGNDATGTTDYSGGGGVKNAGTFTMSGGIISGNTANTGGGIYNTGTLTVTGGEISENHASLNGGGVSHRVDTETKTVTLTGVKIFRNTAENCGGGVYNYTNQGGTYPRLTLNGGTTVSENKAKNGGGIYDGCELFLSDVNVSQNTATEKGGDVYASNRGYTVSIGKLNFSGTTFVGDIYLDKVPRCIVVHSDLALAAGQTVCATITLPDDKYTQGTKVLSAADGSTTTIAANYEKFAVTAESDGTEWLVAADGTLKSSVPEGFVRVSGGTVVGKDNTDNYAGVFIAGRTVTLKSFYMCDHEVTQGEWEKALSSSQNTSGVTASPSLCIAGSADYTVNFGSEQKNRPVENVTWYDAVYYCNIRSEQEGLTKAYDISGITQSGGHITAATVSLVSDADGYRLPTEAEWEFAARGGDPNAAAWDYTFSGAATASGVAHTNSSNAGMDSVGWYGYNNKTGTTTASSQTGTADGKGTHEVKQKAANALGLYDMSGNVYEWCWDWYGTVTAGTETDPTGSASGSLRVYRGGAWNSHAYRCSVSYRGNSSPSSRNFNVGFRVVRSSSE